MELSIKITSELFTNGRLEMKLDKAIAKKGNEKWTQSFSISAGVSTEIKVPAEYQTKYRYGRVLPYAIYLECDDEVMVAVCNNSGNSSDAWVILPENSLGYEYQVAQYRVTNDQYPTQYIVAATEDSSVVQVINKAEDKEKRKKDVPYTFTLNKGEYLSVQGTRDMSGSRITCLNRKKIAVFSGVTCAYVPNTCQSCDLLAEQMIPLQDLKYRYVLVPFLSRDKDVLRIMAKDANTSLEVNGNKQTLLSEGNIAEQEFTRPVYIQSNKQVTVTQFAVGTWCDNKTGDPSMVMAKPLGSFSGTTVLPTFSNDNVDKHYINIILNTEDVSKLRVNGKTVSGKFEKVINQEDLSFIRLRLDNLTNTLQCDCNYTFTVYGFGYFESYAY